MSKIIRRIVKTALYLVLFFFLYVVIALIHGTVTDFQPEEIIPLEVSQAGVDKTIDTDVLTLFNWNIGFCGLGKESNFFFDNGGFFFSGGKMVRANKSMVEKNLSGVLKTLNEHPADFYLLQEVDLKSKRSYYNNELEAISSLFKGYHHTFAVNYNAPRVPLPVCEPWKVLGKIKSGLATLSHFHPTKATRYQYPGQYGWPDRIFHLDRCMAVHRYPTLNGKELIIINSHNSAYDGGVLKPQEMAYMKAFLEKEYAAGNYVIVGADWNQCPPLFDGNSFSKANESYPQSNIDPGYLPADWLWAYDPTIATNRSLVDAYDPTTSFKTLIDFYLVSPNVEVLAVSSVDLDFEYADHQPVKLKVKLKDMMPPTDSSNVATDNLE